MISELNHFEYAQSIYQELINGKSVFDAAACYFSTKKYGK